MNPVTRRIFLKPSGFTEEQLKRFGELLSAALRRQKSLSDQSPYILAPSGDLVETELGFEFEHEPAQGLSIPDLFDPQSPPRAIDELTKASSALVYGLRAGHSAGATVHGGVCPGALVVDASGIWKITDFGFAPAVLAAFESDAFLHLCVGQSAAYPDASGVWEITPDPEEPRDQRLWSFVDPNRYAQALQSGRRQPARFDPISDVISAGFVLYILADRIHPYLKSIDAAEEFRIASYWDMLPTGRPRDILRKDVFADPQSPLFDWWKNFVPKAIERKPEARKTIEELAVRLTTFAPPIDAEQMLAARRAAEAMRWVAVLGGCVERGDWPAVEEQLRAPPVFVPPEGTARVAAAREALAAHQKAQAELQRQQAELADWSAWLDSIQTHVDVEQWDPAAEALKQRRERGLAACPESLRDRWQALTAAVGAGRKERDRRLELAARIDRANAWLVEMRAAADSVDVARIEALGKAAPDTAGCDADLIEEVGGRVQWANDLRSAIAADLAATGDWFAKAEAEAGARRWQAALDMLDELPELSFPPDDLATRIERVRTIWQQKLAAAGDERRAAADAFADALVAECARRRLTDLTPPDAFDAVIQAMLDEERDGAITAIVEFKVEWKREQDRQLDALGQFTCTLNFDGAQPRLMSDAAELTNAIASALTAGVSARQREALSRWKKSLESTFLGGAQFEQPADAPAAQIAAELRWRRDANVASAAVSLEWDARSWSWRPAAGDSSLAGIVTRAVTYSNIAVEDALRAKLPALERWRPLIEISPPQPPPLSWDRLPASLQFNTPVAIRLPGGRPEPLVTAQVAMRNPVETEIKLDAKAMKAALDAVLLKQRAASIAALGEQIGVRLKKTNASIKTAPDAKSSTDAATWTLAHKGFEPVEVAAAWSDSALVFELPHDWQKSVDEYARREPSKPTKEPPAPTPEKPPPAPEKAAPPPAQKAGAPKPKKAAESKPAVEEPAKPQPAPRAPAATEKQPLSPPKPSPSPKTEEPAAPRRRRGHLVIAAVAALAIGGGTIGWFVVNRNGSMPVDPDRREIDEFLAWAKELSTEPAGGPTDAWYANLERSINPPKPKPTAMSEADYLEQLGILNNILANRPKPEDDRPRRLADARTRLTAAKEDVKARRIEQAQRIYDELSKGDLRDDLQSELAILASSISTARTPVVPTQPVEPPVLPQWPAGWEANLTMARVVSDLLGGALTGEYAAAIPANPISRQDDMSLETDGTLIVKLRDGGIGLPELRGTFKPGDRSPNLDAASRKALVNWVVDRTLIGIVKPLVDSGDIRQAIAWKDRFTKDNLFATTNLTPVVQKNLQELAASIPDGWTELPGFTAAGNDPKTGYPLTLTENAPGQRIFKLVRTFPGDAKYEQVFSAVSLAADPGHVALREALTNELTPERLGVQIVYIQTTIPLAAPQPPAAVSTFAEWFLAAATDPSLRGGGRKTWCAGNWACGSTEIVLSGKTVQVPALPATASDADVAAWLANPLTCQKRDPEDVKMTPPIAGYRGVLRMWPKQ